MSAQSSAETTTHGDIYVVGNLDVTTRAVRAARASLIGYAKASRKEPSAGDISVLQEIGYPNRFLILERWSSDAALAVHERGPARSQLIASLAAGALAPADFRTHRDFAGTALLHPQRHGAIYIATHLDAPPPSFAALEVASRAYMTSERSQAGYVGAMLLQHATRPNHLTALEIWRDQSAWTTHQSSPATRRFRSDVIPLIGALYDERIYRAID